MQNAALSSLLLALLATSTAGADTAKSLGELPGFPGLQDRAFTAADQQLLVRTREGVLDVLGATEGWSPVHLIAKRGTVTLLGIVATPQERERVLGAVQEVSGVRRIVDGLQIASERRRAGHPALYARGGITPSGGITRSSGVSASDGVTRATGLTRSGEVNAAGAASSAGISGSSSGSASNSGSLAVAGIVTNAPRLNLLTNQPPNSTTTNAPASSTNSLKTSAAGTKRAATTTNTVPAINRSKR